MESVMTFHRLILLATIAAATGGGVCSSMVCVQDSAKAQVIAFDPPYSRGSRIIVQQNVDREDRTERFLLLAPGAPLVVEVAISIDGKPYRVAREMLIDEMLTQADRNLDGKPTWKEALSSPRFTFARIPASSQQVALFSRTYDKIENGLVDRVEARAYVAQNFQGPAFVLAGNTSVGQAVSQTTDIRKFLDIDKNGVLSRDEVAKATERLKSRDADKNRLVYAHELIGKSTTTRVLSPPVLAFRLGPTADVDTIFASIQERYQDADERVSATSFPVLPKLFSKTDENKNGQLEKAEVHEFNALKPHVKLVVNLGNASQMTKLSLINLADELERVNDLAGRAIVITSPRFKLSFSATPSPRPISRESTGTRYLEQFDKDKNGYLIESEVTGGLSRQFRVWDANGDGRVYAKDIVAAYDWATGPQRSRVRATSKTQGDILFQTLDESNDGRLSLREIGLAAQRIMTFDKNKDGQIRPEETPATLVVVFGQGTARFPTASRSATPAKGIGPEWFVRTDRNGDGDLTLNEFLGSMKQFDELDTNNDGFIDRTEARSPSRP
jgi:Ca2+-binding EF-hand superfamily protein